VSKLITFQYDDLNPALSVEFFQDGKAISYVKPGCTEVDLGMGSVTTYVVLTKTSTLAPYTAQVTGTARLFEDDSMTCTRLAGGVFIMNLLNTIPAGENECFPMCTKNFIRSLWDDDVSVATEALQSIPGAFCLLFLIRF
jgi:hypothetical protein